MTIFSKIFGKRKRTEPVTVAEPQFEQPKVPRDLFVEDRHPDDIERTKFQGRADSSPKPILQTLLERDYHGLGYRDGYGLHDIDKLVFQLEVIASDFRQAYDRALQDIVMDMDALVPHLTDKVQEVAPEIHRKSKTRYEQLDREFRSLSLQKDLALTGEGYIERSIKYYKSGFIEGYEFYLEEKKMFSHPKIL
jgi:hypothetical protein